MNAYELEIKYMRKTHLFYKDPRSNGDIKNILARTLKSMPNYATASQLDAHLLRHLGASINGENGNNVAPYDTFSISTIHRTIRPGKTILSQNTNASTRLDLVAYDAVRIPVDEQTHRIATAIYEGALGVQHYRSLKRVSVEDIHRSNIENLRANLLRKRDKWKTSYALDVILRDITASSATPVLFHKQVKVHYNIKGTFDPKYNRDLQDLPLYTNDVWPRSKSA